MIVMFFWAYLLIVNLIGLILCAWDKRQAKRYAYRVAEKTLFLISAIGGTFGFYAGMLICHHKTLHNRFKFGIPFFCLVWIMLIVVFLLRVGPLLR